MAVGAGAGFILGAAVDYAIASYADIEPTLMGTMLGTLLGGAAGAGIAEMSIDDIESIDRQNTKELQKKWEKENRLDWYNFTDEEKEYIRKH